MNGTKSTLASFQQTSSSARTAHSPRLPCGFGLLNLIFFGSWTIFTRAHGRCSLPEAQASKGIALLFGAPLCGDAATLPQGRIGQQNWLTWPSSSAYVSPLVGLGRWVKSGWVIFPKRSRSMEFVSICAGLHAPEQPL